MTAGQKSSIGSLPVRPPQVFANTLFISSMAMSQRIPSHWSAMLDRVCTVASRIVAGERVELNDVRPRREVRVASVRENLVAAGEPGGRFGNQVVRAAPHEQFRSGRDPRVIGRDMIRHVVEDQPHAPVGERRPRRRKARGATERLVSDVASHAIRRTEHLTLAQIR